MFREDAHDKNQKYWIHIIHLNYLKDRINVFEKSVYGTKIKIAFDNEYSKTIQYELSWASYLTRLKTNKQTKKKIEKM